MAVLVTTKPMNQEIQSDIKHNARKENVFAYLTTVAAPLFNRPKQMESCIRLQIKLTTSSKLLTWKTLFTRPLRSF